MKESRGGKILIIEDDEKMSGLLFSFLSQNGFIVKSVPAADKAMEILGLTAKRPESGKFIPDIILLDLGLPRISGKDFIKIIQKNAKHLSHIPIIILTGHQIEDADILDGLDLGAIDYLCKPFDIDVLLLKIINIIKFTKPPEVKNQINLNHEVYDIKDTAAYLRLTEKTIYNLVRAGKLPALKIGNQWRFSKESLSKLFK